MNPHTTPSPKPPKHHVLVKVGTPVQVYYDMDGNARVVRRVIINDN